MRRAAREARKALNTGGSFPSVYGGLACASLLLRDTAGRFAVANVAVKASHNLPNGETQTNRQHT